MPPPPPPPPISLESSSSSSSTRLLTPRESPRAGSAPPAGAAASRRTNSNTMVRDIWPRITLTVRTIVRKMEVVPLLGTMIKCCTSRRRRTQRDHTGVLPVTLNSGSRSPMAGPSPHLTAYHQSYPPSSKCPDKFTILLFLFCCLLVYTFCPTSVSNSVKSWSEGHSSTTSLFREKASDLRQTIEGSLRDLKHTIHEKTADYEDETMQPMRTQQEEEEPIITPTTTINTVSDEPTKSDPVPPPEAESQPNPVVSSLLASVAESESTKTISTPMLETETTNIETVVETSTPSTTVQEVASSDAIQTDAGQTNAADSVPAVPVEADAVAAAAIAAAAAAASAPTVDDVSRFGRKREAVDNSSKSPVISDGSFTLHRIPLIEADPNFPNDSTGEALMLKFVDEKDGPSGGIGSVSGVHGYHICTFTNVCASGDSIKFRFQNYGRWLEMSELMIRCQDSDFYRKNHLCHCFHHSFKPQILPYEFYAELTESLQAARSSDKLRKDGKSLLSRRYADPFKYVKDIQHQHYWSIHKWVSHHHIAHWSQKLLMFQSIFQHHPLLEEVLPPLTGLMFHDTSNTHPKLEDHLQTIFNVSLEAALGYKKVDGHSSSWAHPLLWSLEDESDEAAAASQVSSLLRPENGRIIWSEDLYYNRYSTTVKKDGCKWKKSCSVPNYQWKKAVDHLAEDQKTQLSDGTFEPLNLPLRTKEGREIPRLIPDKRMHTCFERVSLTPMYGLLSLDAKDIEKFREVTKKRLKIPMMTSSAAPSSPSCPPRRAILLTRPDRKILNLNDIIDHLREEYQLELEIHPISGRNTSHEQVKLFATTGLILSSHSSQMINVLFSHPGQSLIEITPEFYNHDFGAYAQGFGLNFNYALGGTIPRSHDEDPLQVMGHTYKKDEKMLSCLEGLKELCPTGHSWCIMKQSGPLCHTVKEWPNKQMNFYADMTTVKMAIQQAMTHFQERCGGKW